MKVKNAFTQFSSFLRSIFFDRDIEAGEKSICPDCKKMLRNGEDREVHVQWGCDWAIAAGRYKEA